MYFASSVNIHDISSGKALSQDVFKNSHLTIFTYATETEEICSSSRRIKKAKLKCTTCFLSFFFFSTKKHYFFSEVPLLETEGTTKTKKKKNDKHLKETFFSHSLSPNSFEFFGSKKL